jgi:hypothetical protein
LYLPENYFTMTFALKINKMVSLMNKFIINLMAIVSLCCFTTYTVNAQQLFVLSGHVSAPTGTQVDAIADNGVVYSTYTTAGGHYALEVPSGFGYTVRPSNNLHPLNGVNTWDMLLVNAHLENTTPFTTPLQRIAADANNDQLIDSLDINAMEDVLLGTLTAFPNQTSWRFFPRNYVFPDPTSPYVFPDSIVIGPLNNNLPNIDFEGIKIGDIDATAQTNVYNSNSATYQGIARRDDNVNCAADSTELPLSGWIVQVDIDGGIYQTITHNNGYYVLEVPTGGTGTLRLLPKNELWDTCTAIAISPVTGGLYNNELSSAPLIECPRLEVQLSVGSLRRCFAGNFYTVRYCNTGTALAENAFVTLQLDSFLHFVGSPQNYSFSTSGTDTIYRFDLGNLPSGFCGQFTVEVQVSCDAVLGQTHCSNVHIYPDTLCLPGLVGYANLEVEGRCDGDYIEFTITNTGVDMTAPVEYVVIEDIVIQMTSGAIQLNSGESTMVSVLANGSTWRLEVAQPEGHPWSLWASDAVERCGTNGSGSFSLGYITAFPQYALSPSDDEECTENKGSFDPNDKQGFPKGVGPNHVIGRDYPLEYLIRFQNTGTDTAFQVYILDTLADELDPATFRFLGSSHPCNVYLEGKTLRFRFDDIQLPDSTVNEPLSHGFVRFSVRPRPNLPDGTTITNRAGIYFDFNPPVITNYTLHTIETLLVSLPETNLKGNELALEIFPVPATTQLNVHLKTPRVHEGFVEVFDVWGRRVLGQSFDNNVFLLKLDGIPAGTYSFRLVTQTGEVAAGRMVVARL